MSPTAPLTTNTSPSSRRRWPWVLGLIVVIPFLIHSWGRWERYDRGLKVHRFIETTTAANNPWGIKPGMPREQAKKKLEEHKVPFIESMSGGVIDTDFELPEIEGREYILLLEYDRLDLDLSGNLLHNLLNPNPHGESESSSSTNQQGAYLKNVQVLLVTEYEPPWYERFCEYLPAFLQ